VFRSLRAAIGLLAFAVAACGIVPSTAVTHTGHPADPPRFLSIRAALKSDLDKVQADRANEEADVTFGTTNPASACYNLFNNVRYDVEQRLNHDARFNTWNDAMVLQSQITATWHEVVNLQSYNRDFGNNGVTPFAGKWAATAIDAMMARMRAIAGTANGLISQVNSAVAAGFKRYHQVWQGNHCATSKALRTVPVRVPLIVVQKLPPAIDP
jgi:hypothetical protein